MASVPGDGDVQFVDHTRFEALNRDWCGMPGSRNRRLWPAMDVELLTATEPFCPFCVFVLAGRDRPLLAEDEFVVAFEDAYPSTPGHTLVIPRRHIGRVTDMEAGEYAALWSMALSQLRRIEQAFGPAGYTIGINDGRAAGQTVAHVHLHIIPRTDGDTPDPRGGVRWVVPGTADYWSAGR